jgi:hypothetical protein
MVMSGTPLSGTVYNWTRDKTSEVTGIAGSGSGNISGLLTNTTASPVTVTFRITPSFTNFGATCDGTPITATVLVNPLPTITGASTVIEGTTTTLTGSGTAAAHNPWVSSNPTAASVSTAGVVSGILVNSVVTITYTDNNGCKATKDIRSRFKTP